MNWGAFHGVQNFVLKENQDLSKQGEIVIVAHCFLLFSLHSRSTFIPSSSWDSRTLPGRQGKRKVLFPILHREIENPACEEAQLLPLGSSQIPPDSFSGHFLIERCAVRLLFCMFSYTLRMQILNPITETLRKIKLGFRLKLYDTIFFKSSRHPKVSLSSLLFITQMF